MKIPLAADASLYHRTVRGGAWVFSIRIGEQFFNIIRLIILARILLPHDFGLMGIALLTMAFLETFSQTGFEQALIQKKENVESYLNAAWTLLVLRGAVLFIILYFIAPYAANFFKTPEAKALIQVIALAVLLKALTNIGVVYFQKELEFNKQFIYQFSGTVADFVTAITAAVILRSVWALILGLVAGNFVRFIVSYLLHPYRPRLSMDLGKMKELFGFGRWILASSILIFLLLQGDAVFVGKMLGVTALGFYQMAYRMANLTATEIGHVILQVTFPAYSKLQDNIPRLREAYLKTLQLAFFITAPLAGGIFILAPDFIRICLGEKWMPMVPAMQVLALFGMMRAIGAMTGAFFMGIGRPGILTKIQCGQLILLAILIYPLTIHWGITGTAIAVTVYTVIFNSVLVGKVLKTVKSDYRKPGKIILLPLIGTLIMIFAISAMKSYALDTIGLPSFLLLVAAGMFIYLLTTLIFDVTLHYGSKQLIQEQFHILFLKPRQSYNRE